VIRSGATPISQSEGMGLCVENGRRAQTDGQQGFIMGICNGVPLVFVVMPAIGLHFVFPGIALWLPNTDEESVSCEEAPGR
jgi:hypothetical protein